MNKLSYIIFTLLLFPSIVFSASGTMLVNPPALYFSKGDAKSLKSVEDALIDAVERSSSPQTDWTIEETKSNTIVAKVVVRNKHTAYVNIKYSLKKISVEYKSSDNLKYEKLSGGVETIHPRYLEWVDYLVSRIKFATKKHLKNPLTEIDNTPKVRFKGSQHFVITSQAEPGKRDDDYELSSTIERFSATLSNRLVNSLVAEANGNVTTEVIRWGETTERLLKESRKKEVSKSLCAKHKADKIFYALTKHAPGGGGSRNIKYYLYICATDRKIKETYDIDREDDDKYGYQIALIVSTKDFIGYSSAYK